MTDAERLLLLSYGQGSAIRELFWLSPKVVQITQSAGAPLQAHIDSPSVAVKSPTAAKMQPSDIRRLFSVADESGARKHTTHAMRPSVSTISPSIVRVASSRTDALARRTPSLARPDAYNVDELLARCPTLETMAAIRRDFNISFDARLDVPWSCLLDGSESSTMLTIYNVFRAMRLIEFDVLMPVLNTRNLYEWMFSLNLTNIHFTVGEMYSYAERNSISLRGELMDSPDFRQWINPRSGIGLVDVAFLMVHEARHANATGNHNADPDGTIGHVCSRDPSIENVHDPSIAYGGAWSAQYWTARWLADHSGHYLTQQEKMYAAGAAEQIRTSRFCNGGVE